MANPTESALGSSAADALSGTTDPNTGRIYNTIGDSTYYTEHYEHEVIANRVLALANELRVVKDGALTYGVFAGKYMNGTTEVNYAGSTGNALTDDQTNYIYLTAAGTLTKNTTGFPDEGTTPHVPLATILTASGVYDHTDITDCRGRAMWSVLAGISAANLQDRIPTITLTGTDDADGTGYMEIQVKDSGGNSLSQRFLIRTWIADAEFSEPDAQTDFSVTTGEEMQEIEANADYEVISDATGYVKMNIDTSDKTVYVMAEIDGRIYTGSVAITGN
jgi:hypothetical protein